MGITRTGPVLFLLASAVALAAVVAHKKMPGPPLNVLGEGALRTHYLIDYDYQVESGRGEATMGHLVVLNPGDVDAELSITVYFEGRAPESFTLVAPARSSTESNYDGWPVRPGENFALEIESQVPVFCQSTIGWNNTGNDYSSDPITKSAQRPREAARSHLAIGSLADHWYLADGYIIEKPGRTWVRETEQAILLNPHPEDIEIDLTLYSHGEMTRHAIEVDAQRVIWIDMSEFAPANQHYGARFASSSPFAAQWMRAIYWADSDELMTYWSVPLAPLADEVDD